jgi:hypothetical protein
MVNLAAALVTTSLIIIGCVAGMVVMIVIFRDSIHEHMRSAAMLYHASSEDETRRTTEKIDQIYREAKAKVRRVS